MKLLQSDLCSMLESDLRLKLKELRALFFQLRSEYKFVRKLEKPHMLRDVRKSIARVLTEINKRSSS